MVVTGANEVTLEGIKHQMDIDAGGTTTPSNLREEGSCTMQKGAFSNASVLRQDAAEHLGTYMTNANLRISEPFLNIHDDQVQSSNTFTTDAINAETFKK